MWFLLFALFVGFIVSGALLAVGTPFWLVCVACICTGWILAETFG